MSSYYAGGVKETCRGVADTRTVVTSFTDPGGMSSCTTLDSDTPVR